MLAEKFLAARRAKVPLVAVTTSDPRAAMQLLVGVCEAQPGDRVSWDIASGAVPVGASRSLSYSDPSPAETHGDEGAGGLT